MAGKQIMQSHNRTPGRMLRHEDYVNVPGTVRARGFEAESHSVAGGNLMAGEILKPTISTRCDLSRLRMCGLDKLESPKNGKY